MGLSGALGLQRTAQNGAQRAVARLAATRTVSWILSWSIRPADRVLLRLSGGKVTVTTWLAGLPVLWLTVAGRRSGLPQTVPLLAIPVDESVAVIGSNFGSRGHPSWARNLEVAGEASVAAGPNTARVTARVASGDARDRIWQLAVTTYPGYSNYRAWAEGRDIKVFLLEQV